MIAGAAGAGRRVVVTGVGLVTPLGCGRQNVWASLLRGDCGVGAMEQQGELGGGGGGGGVSVAARVREGDFSVEELFGKQSGRYRSRATHFALHASDLALQDAGFNGGEGMDLTRAGVAVASGIGSMQDICDGYNTYLTEQRRLSPFFVSKILISSIAGEVSIRHKLQGPNHAVATACAASAHAIGDAYNFIRLGYADLMVAGGSEAAIDPLTVAGFAKMRALSRNTDPLTASSPFDVSRNGFVIGEGAGILVLESLESATKRNANIVAEIVGYGLSGDAHHITSPPEDGGGALRAMRVALKDAGLTANDISYVNAHATSTPNGDLAEMNALHSLFATSGSSAKDLFVSSTKGSTGHLLGAAGAVEGAFTCLALQSNMLPPTLNLKEPVVPSALAIDACDDSKPSGNSSKEEVRNIRHVTQTGHLLPTDGRLTHAISNSFGFGGTNASLVFKKWAA